MPWARVAGFSPDGRELAVSLDQPNGELEIVNIETGRSRLAHRLPWASDADPEGSSAAEAPPIVVDGGAGIGASGGLDGTVTVWDTSRRQPMATLRVPGVLERPFLIFDRAGERLAITTAVGAAAVVDLSVKSWYSYACRLAGRTLNSSEWRVLVGAERTNEVACQADPQAE